MWYVGGWGWSADFYELGTTVYDACLFFCDKGNILTNVHISEILTESVSTVDSQPLTSHATFRPSAFIFNSQYLYCILYLIYLFWLVSDCCSCNFIFHFQFTKKTGEGKEVFVTQDGVPFVSAGGSDLSLPQHNKHA